MRLGLPFWAGRTVVETVLRECSPRFTLRPAQTGHPSIPPEQLLRALLLQIVCQVPSERQRMEQLEYNLPPVCEPEQR